MQSFLGSPIINILWLSATGAVYFYQCMTLWEGLFVGTGANNEGILLSPDDKLSSLPLWSHGISL